MGQVQTRRELATLLGCDESTVYRWFCLYRSEGLVGLLQVKTSPGKPSKLPPDVLEGLRQRLQARDGFHSYGEIQALVGEGVQCAGSVCHSAWDCPLQTERQNSKRHAYVSLEADPRVQAALKKNSLTSVQVMNTYFGQGLPIRYFYGAGDAPPPVKMKADWDLKLSLVG